MTEGKQKILADNLNFGWIDVWLRFVLAILIEN